MAALNIMCVVEKRNILNPGIKLKQYFKKGGNKHLLCSEKVKNTFFLIQLSKPWIKLLNVSEDSAP